MSRSSILILACALVVSACKPGPPATFYQRSNSSYVGAPGNFAP